MAPLDAVYAPVGLGSGICGTILTRDPLGFSTKMIGVQGTGVDCYAHSFTAGHVVAGQRADIRADGIAVRQPDPDAFRIIRADTERIVTVSDQQIAAAVSAYWTDTHNRIKGVDAAPLAALMQDTDVMHGRRAALIASGGHIDLALCRAWVA